MFEFSLIKLPTSLISLKFPLNSNHNSTNADYYPIAASESQSNNNFNTANQQNEKQESSFDSGHSSDHQKTWTHILNAPKLMLQKWKKLHADLTGRGAFYGSDYFAGES